MKKSNLVSWVVTMLVSLGTFAGALTVMGTLDVPSSSTVGAPAQSTATPSTSSITTSPASSTPASLASPPAGGGEDDSSRTNSSSSPSLVVSGSDN